MDDTKNELVVALSEHDELVIELPEDETLVHPRADETHVTVDESEPPESHGLRRDHDALSRVGGGG
jgi:hypothetical protein